MPNPTGVSPKSGSSFLNKKGPGGIPYWIYTALAVVLGYLAYRWYSNRTPSTSSGNSATCSTQPSSSCSCDLTSSSPGGGSSPSCTSGCGGSGSSASCRPGGGYPFFPWGGGGQISQPCGLNPNPTTTKTGSLTPGLVWGTQTYTTRSAFESYLASKGISLATFALKHPAAYAEYLGLPAGAPGIKATKKGTKQTTKPKATAKAPATPTVKRATKAGVATSGRILRKTSVKSTAKAPIIGSNLGSVSRQFAGEGITTAKQPAPIKAPPKTTVKGTPEARPVAVRPIVAKPPVKRKK